MGSIILGVDAGEEESGWLRFRPRERLTVFPFPGTVIEFGIEPNTKVRDMIRNNPGEAFAGEMAIEVIRFYGTAHVGLSTFVTCEWVGRFKERFIGEIFDQSKPDMTDVVCNSRKANDSAVRAALCDMWGGEKAAIGNKKEQGPLYGITKHAWMALGHAVARAKKREIEERAQGNG